MSYNLVLTLRLRTNKKLVIGSGGLTLVTKSDIPFTRVKRISGGSPEKVLFIPGSTIKGVLRTALIRTAHLIGFENVSASVYPNEKASPLDIISSLFGRTSGPASKLIVDCCMINSLTNIITHVKINDKSKTAEEGGLFSVEYLPIGYSFKIRVKGYDLSLHESRALFLSVLELKYERIGKSGLVDVSIVMDESEIPNELKEDPVIREILEGIET